MASKKSLTTESGERISRSDILKINPMDIVIDMDHQGRAYNHDEAAIEEMAESFRLPAGQLQPVTVRRVNDKFVLVFGFRRVQAAILLRETTDPQFKIAATVFKGSEEEAFLMNVIENQDRRSTNAIDHAFIARKLEMKYGYDQERICKVLKCQPSWLGKIMTLLTLPDDIKRKVYTGEMNTTTAIELAAIGDDKDRREALADATNIETGKIERSKVTQAVRSKTNRKMSRSISEVKKFLKERVNEHACAVSQAILHYIAGNNDTEVEKILSEYDYSDAKDVA